MKLHDLSPNPGSTKKRKRLGRGPGSGVGKTAGRGHNGQRSRSGFSQRLGFEGGQMPLIRRVPKRGFTNIFRKEYAVVNIVDLVDLEETTITKELLVSEGIVRAKQPVKLLGDGEIDRALTVRVDKYSASAKQKIEAAGGTCEEPSS